MVLRNACVFVNHIFIHIEEVHILQRNPFPVHSFHKEGILPYWTYRYNEDSVSSLPVMFNDGICHDVCNDAEHFF